MGKNQAKTSLYKGAILAKIISFLAKAFGFRLPPIVSACAIIKDKSKILAIRLSYRDGLSLPGGMSNENETFEETLAREVFEETGLRIVDKKYFGSYNARTKLYYVTTACFLVNVVGDIRSSNEGEVVWVSPQDFIKDSAYKDNTEAVREYLNKYGK